MWIVIFGGTITGNAYGPFETADEARQFCAKERLDDAKLMYLIDPQSEEHERSELVRRVDNRQGSC
jgi:hypothetical protein